jgi:hypothetical protein
MSKLETYVEKYIALLDLERSEASRTTKARNELIRSIPENELADFALQIKLRGALSHDRTNNYRS